MRAILILIIAATVLPHANAQTSIVWTLPTCAMAIAVVDAPPESTRAHLPPGFTPMTWGPLDQAKVIVQFVQCEDVSYGNWEVAVTPPAELTRREPASANVAYYVKYDTLIPDAATRRELAAWGLPVHGGSASIGQTPVPGVYVAQLEMDGVGTFVLHFTPTSDPHALEDLRFVEYTPTRHGELASWEATLENVAHAGAAAGTLRVPPETVLAELLGSHEVVADVYFGYWGGLVGRVDRPLPSSMAVEAPAGDRLRIAPLAGAFVGGALGAGIAWRISRWFGAAAGYTRMTADEAATHPRRQAILALIRARPGITSADLRETTGYARGVILHHLGLLQQHGRVQRTRDGWRTRWYEAGVDPTPIHPPRRASVRSAIQVEPGITQRELAERLGLSRWSIAHHTRILHQAGLIQITAYGREKRYAPTNDE